MDDGDHTRLELRYHRRVACSDSILAVLTRKNYFIHGFLSEEGKVRSAKV